jgi:hypothetical protein
VQKRTICPASEIYRWEGRVSKLYRTIRWFVLVTFIAACTAPTIGTTATSILSEAKIVRYPEPADLSGNYLELTSIPKFDRNSTDQWQIDLRYRDLTKINMMDALGVHFFAEQNCVSSYV